MDAERHWPTCAPAHTATWIGPSLGGMTTNFPRLLRQRPVGSLDEYIAEGGGSALRRAADIGAEATVAEIAAAGLRGRGGGGFPTGTKWRTLLTSRSGYRYAVCNAGEGEPATFKDRALLRTNPYAVLEGLLLAGATIGAAGLYICLKASFTEEMARVREAASAMADAGWVGDAGIDIVAGPEEYLLGEEKAMLEVIEGNDPLPRWLPPYLHGLFATAPQLGWESSEPSPDLMSAPGTNPTLVNNAETLAQAAWIVANGAGAFRSLGTEQSPGTVICTVIGDVTAPGVVEVPMGTSLADVIDACGGPARGRTVKAVFPGVANAVLTGEDLATPLTYEDFSAAGSGLGAAGFMVYDDSACMVEAVAVLSRFLWVESCGQCLPCKLGTGAITGVLERIRTGTGSDADLDVIQHHLAVVSDGNRCYLPVQERNVVSSVLDRFPGDFAAHLDGWCPSERTDLPVPKIADIVDGRVFYDERQALKNPDWTYSV